MGIPPPPEYGNDCPVCWPAGMTPKYVYIDFVGIQRGALGVPPWPDPPNGTWKLEQTIEPCKWYSLIDPFQFWYQVDLPGTLIAANVFDVPFCFVNENPADCIVAGDNDLVNPAGFYYGGSAKVSWV